MSEKTKYLNISGQIINDLEKTKAILLKTKFKEEIFNEDGSFIVNYESGIRKSTVDKVINNIKDFKEFKLYESKEEQKKKKEEDQEENKRSIKQLVNDYFNLSYDEQQEFMTDKIIENKYTMFKTLIAKKSREMMKVKTEKKHLDKTFNAHDEIQIKKFDISILRPKQRLIMDIILNIIPDDRKIHIIRDDGGTGKSWLCKFLILYFRGVVIADGKKDNIFNSVNTLIEEGIMPSIFILDVPRAGEDYLNYGVLEQIKNGLFYSGKYVGGLCIYPPPHIFIFCNFEVDTSKWTSDRPVFINYYEEHNAIATT